MPQAAIALGSNLGEKKQNLDEAVRRLGTLGEIIAVSDWIETQPVGIEDQPTFLNGAALLDTDLEPVSLMEALLSLELLMGRKRDKDMPKGPRLIDLDLVLYGEQVVETPSLVLPHPEMASRRFVLEPLADIAPEWVEPVSGLSVRELLVQLDAVEVRPA